MARKWITLLMCLVLGGLLVAVLLPSLSRARYHRGTLCMANLRAQAAVFQLCAADFDGKWPATTGDVRSFCEQPLQIRDAFTFMGKQTSPSNFKRMFYCPNKPGQDPEKLWQVGDVSVWGYTWLNDRGAAGKSLPTTFPAHKPPLTYHTAFPTAFGPNIANTELALDVIVSDTNGGAINFSPAGAVVGTNHMLNGKPQGASVVCLDGHVEWRPFVEKKAAAVKDGTGLWVWFPGQ